MYKKITLALLLFLQIIFANGNIFVYPKTSQSTITVKFNKQSNANYIETISQDILYLGYKQGWGKKIFPRRFTDQTTSLFNLNKVYVPSNMNVQAIRFDIMLSEMQRYGNEYYKLDLEEEDRISATIVGDEGEKPAQLTIQNINPSKLKINAELRTLTLRSFLTVLRNHISPQGEAWNIDGNKIMSDFFETVTEDKRPKSDYLNIKIGALEEIKKENLKIQALSENRNKIIELKIKKVGPNEVQIPNLDFYNLNCWYKNQKRKIRKVFETKDYINSRVVFNYIHKGEKGQYVKAQGENKIYLPYPQEDISTISCTKGGERMSVTLNKDNTLDISEPIAIVIDLNSTRTTNKKNMYDYKDFIRKLIKGSENTNIKVFKLLYTYPRPATFNKFKIDKVYTKFKNSKFATVNSNNASKFVKWRRRKEGGTIDPMQIPQNYFCIEEITGMNLLEGELSTTIVKEDMANQKYIQNFQKVLNRLNNEMGYSFEQVYYISYFPALQLYKLDGVKYKSFLKSKDNFSISSIIKESK